MACVFSHLVSTSSIVSALALPARGRDVTSNDGSDDAAFARGLSAASMFVPEGFDTFEAMMLLECSGNNMVVDRSAAHCVVKERGRTRMWSVLQVSSFAFALLREGERSTEREDTCNSAPQITPTITRIRRSHPTVFPC